jgi:branched-chain amino acid transport system permease protein
MTTIRKSVTGIAAGIIVLGIAAAALPGLSSYFQQIIVLSMIYVVLVSSLDMLAGTSGLLSLGHQGFFGLGAYLYAIISIRYGVPTYIALLITMVAAVPIAYILGRFTLRLRAAFFVIATLAFALIFGHIVINTGSVTGGPNGLPNVPPLSAPGGFVFASSTAAFIPIGITAIASVYASWRLKISGIGVRLGAFRENEDVAKAFGVDVPRTIMKAFIISSMPASLAGGLYAGFIGLISPEIFSLSIMATVLLMLVAGGIGTVVGPVLGAIAFTVLPEALRFSDQWRLVIYGCVLIALARFLPDGLWGFVLRSAKRLRRGSAGTDMHGVSALSVVQALHRPERARATKTDSPGEENDRVLAFDDIAVSFGSLRAVDKVSVRIQAGQKVGLIGPNGAGKSSFFNAATGYLGQATGRVSCNGRPLRLRNPWEFAHSGVIRTFQNENVFGGLTVEENIRAALAASGRQPTDLASRPELTARLAALEQVDKTARDLPYGQRRFLNVCCALLVTPDYVLLDEPAAGLNEGESDQLAALLNEAAKAGVGVLVVEHDMPFLMGLCDYVYAMDAGILIGSGTPEQIQHNNKVREAYLGVAEDSHADA